MFVVVTLSMLGGCATPARVPLYQQMPSVEIGWYPGETYFVLKDGSGCFIGAPDRSEWSALGMAVRDCFDGKWSGTPPSVIDPKRVRFARIEWQRLARSDSMPDWQQVGKLCAELNFRRGPASTDTAACWVPRPDRHILIAFDRAPWEDLGHEAAHAFCGRFHTGAPKMIPPRTTNACLLS